MTNGWTTRLERHGNKNGFTTSIPTGEANQFVGSAPFGTPDSPQGQIIGADETPHAISLLRAADPTAGNGEKFNFERLFGPGGASTNRAASNSPYVFNCFRIACADYADGGPFAAMMAPGSQNGWSSRNEASRILYSPDGYYWGQCFPPNHGPVMNTAFSGSRIVFGSQGGDGFSNNLRSIPTPRAVVSQPFLVSSGGTNLLNGPELGPASGTVGANNTVTNLTSSAAINALTGILPPCNGPVFRVQSPLVTGTRELGIWRLTSIQTGQLLPANSKIKVRFWVYPLRWNDSNQPVAASLTLRAALGQYRNAAGDSPSDSIGASREQFSLAYPEVGDPVRGWFPVTLDTEPRFSTGTGENEVFRWTNDGGVSAPPAANSTFPLGLRLSSRTIPAVGNAASEPPNPCDFLIAFDYVVAGAGAQEHSGIALPVSSSPTLAGDEQAAITGFACFNNWTIELAGEVPDHAWDLTDESRPFNKVLCTLWQSGTQWASLEIVMPSSKLRLRFSNNTVLDLEPPASSFQTFSFLRSTPVLLGVCHQLLPTGQAVWKLFASVGGSEVFSATVTNSAAVIPTQIRFGDKDKQNAEAMLWYAGRIHESASRTDTQMRSALQNLEMFSNPFTVAPPGSGGVA